MKKLKKILSIVLTIIVVFCSFPLSSYAEDREGFFGETYSLGGIVAPGLEQSFGSNAFSSPYFTQLGASVPKYREVTSLCFNLVNDSAIIDKGDKVTISVENLNSNILSCSTYANVSASYKGKSYDTVFAAGTFNNNVCSYVFEAPGNIDYLFIEIYQNDIVYSKSVNLSSPAVLGLRSALYNTEDTKTGLLRTILDWLKAIKDSITEIPSKVQSFFTELKTQLSTAFSNIGTWFKELGNNISDWLFSLGNRIGIFFDDLSSKLTIKLIEIKTSFTDFVSKILETFNSITQSIHDFFVPDKAYLDTFYQNLRYDFQAMFGFLYESVILVQDILYEISHISEEYGLFFEIPEIKIPIVNVVILEKTTFYLDDYFFMHPAFEKVYNFYYISVSAIMYFSVIFLAYKRLMSIIADRSDV